jgi:GDP-L-fucose synthase
MAALSLKKSDPIFVAGHRGMVGSAVVRELKLQGYTNILTQTRQELDLSNQAAVDAFFASHKPKAVVVAAALVGGIKPNNERPADFLYQNLILESNVIWSAFKHDTRKLLFLGSSCIYPRASKQPIREEYLLSGPLEPTNEGYAIAKIAGMKLCEKIFQQYGREFISCMPTNLYGPFDNFDLENAHVLPALMRKFHEAKQRGDSSITLWGSGIARREFLHVNDLARAIVMLLESYSDKQFVNVGTGEDVTIKELAELIREVVSFTGSIAWDTTKPDGMLRKLLNVDKIHALGWKHTIELREGVQQTYDWFKTHAAAKNFDRYAVV